MRQLQKLVISATLAMSLTGCAWHNSGPCYGVGCPTWATAAPQGTAPALQKSSASAAPAIQAPHPESAPSTAANPAPAAPRTPQGEFAQLFKRVKARFAPAAKPATSSAATPTGSPNGR
jgi:hypothetical protein